MLLTDYKLNRRSFTPLYQQIKDLLLAQINQGELSAVMLFHQKHGSQLHFE